MYRVLCAVFFCITAAAAAPQDASDLTFVKPLTGIAETSSTESLETIPLTTRRENPDSNIESTPSIASEDNNEENPIKPDVSTANYETSSEATEKNLSEEIAPQTEKPRVKSSFPRFTSKLGYFKNSDKYSPAVLTNFIERTGKRKFKSRCRCERITNCPKLQISVPRCPEEYFLCCF